VDAPDGSRPVKTAGFEQLADYEAMGLFGAHLFGSAGAVITKPINRIAQSISYPAPLFPIGNGPFNKLFTITFAVELHA
jgi:hypothetical protein